MKYKVVSVLVIAIALLIAGGMHHVTEGATVVGGNVTFGCTSFNGSTYTVRFDRSNAGPGQERFIVRVTDGVGKVLYEASGNRPVGSVAPMGGPFSYVRPPEYNPITLVHISPAGNGYDQQIVATFGGKCEGLPWAPSGEVPVPPGFEQREITCDVPVYDQPAGSPVGENVVTTGQHWYVNLTPVPGPDGRNWTEIFVAGPNTGFIPTACVQ